MGPTNPKVARQIVAKMSDKNKDIKLLFFDIDFFVSICPGCSAQSGYFTVVWSNI